MKIKYYIYRLGSPKLYAVPLLLLAFFLGGCGGDGDDPAAPIKPSSGFTFFDLGAESVYSKALRKKLETELGSDAISTRTLIDLSINYPDFLKIYFPKLHDFNLRLNNTTGARIEHNTTKLMYRYPHRNNRPFKNVELMFSNFTRNPLYFKILANKEGSAIVTAFEEKYGSPEAIDWQSRGGTTRYWTKENQLLAVSVTKDRFGDQQYLISIYYMENIQRLLDTEEKERQKRAEEKQTAGKKAF
jgi:hypothetical protein